MSKHFKFHKCFKTYIFLNKHYIILVTIIGVFLIACESSLFILFFIVAFIVIKKICCKFSVFSLKGLFCSVHSREHIDSSEYQKQANEFTCKALKELKSFCKSNKCDTWCIVSKLKSPKRFSKFVLHGIHFTEDEQDDYDRYMVENDMMDEEDFCDDGAFIEG